jgi:hypothetical protein
MSHLKPQLPENIDLSTYEIIERAENNQIYIGLNKPLVMQLPKSRCPFGVSDGSYKGAPHVGGPVYSVNIEAIPEQYMAVNSVINQLETKLITYLSVNSQKFFKKQLNVDGVRGSFNNSIRGGDATKSYNPTLKAKFIFKKDKNDKSKIVSQMFNLFDATTGNPIKVLSGGVVDFSVLSKFDVLPIISFGSVTIVTGKATPSWNLNAAKVFMLDDNKNMDTMFINTDVKVVEPSKEIAQDAVEEEEEEVEDEEEE